MLYDIVSFIKIRMTSYVSWVSVTKVKPELHLRSIYIYIFLNVDEINPSLHTVMSFFLLYLNVVDMAFPAGHFSAWKGFQ